MYKVILRTEDRAIVRMAGGSRYQELQLRGDFTLGGAGLWTGKVLEGE